MRSRMHRKLTIMALTALVALIGLVAWHNYSPGANQGDKNNPGDPNKEKPAPAATLPVTQVILFNSGVGYYQREGDVQGDTNVQLTFPAGEINDLLKSLVLQDQDKGRVGVITYDSHDPVDKTLRSFAVNLNGNPTYGQILNQARGEKVEVVFRPRKDAPTEKLTGTLVGMQSQAQQIDKDRLVEVELLNLLGVAGLQSLPLEQVQTVRFLNPNLQTEFERALQVLATTHDTQKKTIDLQFLGHGKRRVKVGYVVERPIWKTSYRLLLKDNGKLFLQGWALVENTSDDDWKGVRVILVSGRPISYQMNLYESLYIPRPWVEPELFASLRPPVYSGALDGDKKDKQPPGFQGGQGFNPMMGMGGMGMGGMGMMGGGMGMMGMYPGMGMNPMMNGMANFGANRYQNQGLNPMMEPQSRRSKAVLRGVAAAPRTAEPGQTGSHESRCGLDRHELQGRHHVGGDRRGTGGLLPVRHRAKGNAAPAKVGDAAHPQPAHYRQQGQHL